MSVSKELIEQAKEYSILPLKDGKTAIEIGGDIELNFIVLQQMKDEDIVMTAFTEGVACLIMVDYSVARVLDFIKTGREKMMKLGIIKSN